MGDLRAHRQRALHRRHLGARLRRWRDVGGAGANRQHRDQLGSLRPRLRRGRHDFLSTDRTCDNVTNPPFHSAEGFVARALQQARGKVALLLRLAFLEGANRCRTIFRPHPPSRVWVFTSGSPSTRQACSAPEAARPPTPGSSGTRATRGRRKSTGWRPATRRSTADRTLLKAHDGAASAAATATRCWKPDRNGEHHRPADLRAASRRRPTAAPSR